MSDSSENEDLSKFKEAAVDALQFISKPEEKLSQKSNRILRTSSHYNDVKIPEEMQKRIGAKVSALIEKNITFIDVPHKKNRKQEIKGGVKLFNTSTDFLTCEVEKDLGTELHNKQSKILKNKKRKFCEDMNNDDIESITVSGEYILSGEETKLYKSRRKDKLYKYTVKKNCKYLVALE